jgi:hypothetical protein
MPMSKNGSFCVDLTVHRSLPFVSDKRTFSESVGMKGAKRDMPFECAHCQFVRQPKSDWRGRAMVLP